jgi:hypothetical protein
MKFKFVLAAALVLAAFSNHASADIIVYDASMTGANEVPPTGSPATGFSEVILNTALNTLMVDLTFSGLTGGDAEAAHIHCCTLPGTNAAVAVPFVGFPSATSGTYDHTFDLTDPTIYTSGFLAAEGGTAAGAEAGLIAGLNAHEAYTNIHNTTFPGGEIRGLLSPVPEPSTWLLSVAGLALMFLVRGFAARTNTRV